MNLVHSGEKASEGQDTAPVLNIDFWVLGILREDLNMSGKHPTKSPDFGVEIGVS